MLEASDLELIWPTDSCSNQAGPPPMARAPPGVLVWAGAGIVPKGHVSGERGPMFSAGAAHMQSAALFPLTLASSNSGDRVLVTIPTGKFSQ